MFLAGRYMYVEVNGKQNGDIARISSPLVSVSQKTTKCLKFWYHMYGPHIASLNVYANTTSLGFPIWSKNGTQGNKWKLAKVDVVMSQSYSVSFFLLAFITLAFITLTFFSCLSMEKKKEFLFPGILKGKDRKF